ncbi:hypothetical protein [Cetobacterium sp.]|uniref:hypothetical protein n=1 Tax=Cetobacterium sp. TaxID=2071632 RepID=UPI003F3C03EC
MAIKNIEKLDVWYKKKNKDGKIKFNIPAKIYKTLNVYEKHKFYITKISNKKIEFIFCNTNEEMSFFAEIEKIKDCKPTIVEKPGKITLNNQITLAHEDSVFFTGDDLANVFEKKISGYIYFFENRIAYEISDNDSMFDFLNKLQIDYIK